ncbi:OsmC family protein [Pricia sp. S334]|uniref:OsmC family protein n=1 Tax=Pricia mediterranea TaxID=3076079 RepID=A0ABU3L925_9FLAO|nr:OsmC family protein [Pricia sp. S334]MDT7829689.1 OsmC family protein [Pricia sp. S334]
MNRQHNYSIQIKWTGNSGIGTARPGAYKRSHAISIEGKPDILGSSDPAFRGDGGRHNPEELLVASLSCCHMLWYLHLCSEADVIVTDYTDKATGTMFETDNGSGYFENVVLHPTVTVSESSMTEKANQLHDRANELCFIANSVNFKVEHRATCLSK